MAYADLIELNRRQPRRILQDAGNPHPDERKARLEGRGFPAPQDEDSARSEGGPGERMTSAASFLAYLGAAPLIAAALLMIAIGDGAYAAARFMTLYGAALIIFFGGVRWGVAVMKPEGPTLRALAGAALPMIAALPLLAAGETTFNMIAIMVLMAALLLDDLGATRRGSGAPAWYLGVRLPLTVLIEVAFLVALAAGVRG